MQNDARITADVTGPEKFESVPDTKLVELLVMLNRSWSPAQKSLSPAQHVLGLLKEEGRWEELMKFLMSYIASGPDDAANGMCVMFLLGWFYAKGGVNPRIIMPDKDAIPFLTGRATMKDKVKK